jgi:small-conductance mechanosensitive channel
VLATLALWFLLRAMSRAGKWINARFSREMERRTERLHLPPSGHASQLNHMLHGIVRAVAVVLGLVLINVWLTFVLKQFPYTYPWGDQIDNYLLVALSSIGLAILHSVPDMLMLVLIFLIARFVTRWLGMLFDAVRAGRFTIPGVDEETALPAKRLTTLFLWVLTFALAYPFIPGSQGAAFKGVSVLLGVMVSLGSSNVLSQAASGYMLMFSKALRVNDYIRIDENEGTVISIGVLSTKIRTPRDEEINVPNTVIVGTTTKNFTRLNRELGAPVTTTVTIGYSAPWRQVHAMMKEAASKTEGLRTTPEPTVLQSSLSDFYVEYTLLARLEKANERTRVLSRLHANIQDLFNEYGVQIMSPHYEGDPDGKVWVPKEKWNDAPAPSETKGG